MNIYQDSGYIDIRKILAIDLPFNFIVGGRATGKTYTSLETVIEDNIRFLYMRRTQTQMDLINKPEFSPYKILNTNFSWNIHTKPISKYNSAFYKEDETICGYTAALSTISNLRGFDASDVDLWVYDEFISESHERPLKNEAAAFLNAYETINRNRELTGKKPLQFLGLANANDLANPIFLELKLVRKAEQMRRKGQEVYIDRARGIGLFILDHSPISEHKRETALYRLTKESIFAQMALNNVFSSNEIGRIISRPLAEYRPIVTIGEICIYQHKYRHELYVSTHITGTPPTFETSDTERARFIRAYPWIWDEYMKNNVEFEEFLCEALLTKIYS